MAQIGKIAPPPPPPPPPPPTGALPATITTGGTYSGTRQGTVQIRTAQPVVIENSAINIYRSSLAKVHDNYVQGAYPSSLTGGYAGGGIIIDGSTGHDNEVFENIVVDTVNHGLAISGGRDNRIFRNRAVFDGRNDAGQMFAAANIGLYVYDFSSTPSFTGNQMFGNEVAWTKENGQRNDTWLPSCQGQCSNSVLKPGAVIAPADEQAEFSRWQAKLAANGISIGA